MSLITIDVALTHLRVGADYPQGQVEPYLNAAEQMAIQFINRRVFVDQAALTAAIAAIPAALEAAELARSAALVVADALSSEVARCEARRYAEDAFATVQTSARETYAGVSLDVPEIAYLFTAGVLLILGHLFENREEVVVGTPASRIPMGAHNVLMPLRTGMGV